MRIIAGKARGRTIRAPRGDKTRPTTDRVREALFSLVEARLDLEGARVLDLFSGSGALALEALSRGAAWAVCVERAAAARRVIEQNATAVGLAPELELMPIEVERALSRLSAEGRRFELILLDPPYAEAPWPTVARLLALGLLAPGGLVVVEHEARAQAPKRVLPAGGGVALEVIRQRCYGDTALAVYALGGAP